MRAFLCRTHLAETLAMLMYIVVRIRENYWKISLYLVPYVAANLMRTDDSIFIRQTKIASNAQFGSRKSLVLSNRDGRLGRRWSARGQSKSVPSRSLLGAERGYRGLFQG